MSGWRIGGLGAWLWTFTNRWETAYSIRGGRGFAEAAEVLGQGYAGTLVADGWAPYRRFAEAKHQTCLAHLLRRCREMLETAQGGAVRFPSRVLEILQAALAVRDRREAQTISRQGVKIARGRLAVQMDRLLSGTFTHPGNLRLAKHLRRYQKTCSSSWTGRMSKPPTGRLNTRPGRLDEPPANLSTTGTQLHRYFHYPPPKSHGTFIL